MHGRRALAAILVSAALAGCGTEAQVEPARIEIKQEPAAKPAQPGPGAARPRTRKRVGRTVSGTFRTAPAAHAPVTPRGRPKRARRPDYARFRAGQLEVLRAHCASRPANEPRCNGTQVDERVAFAPFEAAR